MPESTSVNITKADLAAIVAAAVRAAREPDPPTAQALAEEALAQQERKDTAASVMLERARKQAERLVCSHEHPKREGGSSHCVWVKESDPLGSLGYIYCMLCEGRFRPESFPQKLDPDAIYSTSTFNKLFQDCADAS